MNRLLTLFVLFIFGCNPKVIHYLNESAPYSGFNTFQITNVKVNNAELSDTGQEIMKLIELNIIQEMKRRDYQVKNDPDVVVRYELISNQRTDVNMDNFGLYNPMYYPYRSITVRTFLESALLIEIINLKTKKAVWHASVDMDKYKKQRNTDKIIQKAVQNIYNTYLYRAGTARPDNSLIIE